MNYLNKMSIVIAAQSQAARALDIFDIDQPSHQTVSGDQQDLTLDSRGEFKHPFLEQSHVDTIHYPDSGTFSVKLNEVKLPTE